MSSEQRRRFLVMAVAACLAAVGATIAVWPRAAAITPGMEVLSVAPGDVRILTYRTDLTLVVARRDGADGFAIAVTDRGGNVRHCAGTADLSGIVPALATLVARRPLAPGQVAGEFPNRLGTLTIVDRVEGAPMEPFLVRASPTGAALAFVQGDVAFEATLAPSTLKRLAALCSG